MKKSFERAKLLNISVNSETNLEIIEDIAKNQELTVDKLRKKLKNAGINFEDFKKIRNGCIALSFEDKELDQKLYVSDTEAENFLLRS